MSQARWRRGLTLGWWGWLGLCALPLVAASLLVGYQQDLPDVAMLLFVVGMLSMLVSLPCFQLFRRALLALQKALGSPDEQPAWKRLAQARRLALLASCLPAWVAALAMMTGLEGPARSLMLLSSLALLLLYRIPRQLG